MKLKPAKAAIRKALRDQSGGIEVNATEALIQVEAKASDNAFMKMLGDEHWYFRQSSA